MANTPFKLHRRVDRWRDGEAASASKANQSVDTINTIRDHFTGPTQHRTPPVFTWRYGVVRGYVLAEGEAPDENTPLSHMVAVSEIRPSDSGSWVIPENNPVPMYVEPLMQASDYLPFFRALEGEDITFPYELLVGMDIRPLPIVRAYGRTTVLHHSPLYYPTPLPETLHHTDSFIQDGNGVVSFD